MKLTSTVNLWCHLSFVLAAKAMSSNLLPEYQHGYLHHGNASILSSPTNTSANVSLLLAPSYRNVTAGGAWILPASPFDLGARAMTCECFDPDEKCCMGSPPVVGPFCIPQNATCCSSTVCEQGETCCGDYCCRSGTKCSTDGENPGCCPLGHTCSADTPPTCIDHSSNCSGKFPPKQCCPSDLPFCSSQEGKGFGCYASAMTVSSTQTISTQTVNLPRKTSSHHSRGTTTLIETVSVKIASASSGGGIALEVPKTVTLGTDLSGWSISTSYVFSFPSSIFGTPETTVVGTSISNLTGLTGTSISLFSTTTNTTTTSTSHASHPSAPKSATTTSPSLCFNPVLQTLGHCPTSTSTSSTSTSVSSSNSAYPTELIIHSSAPHLHLSRPHPIILALLLLHLGLGIAIVPLETILNWVLGMGVLAGIYFRIVKRKEGEEGDGTMLEKAVCYQDKVEVSGKGNRKSIKVRSHG